MGLLLDGIGSAGAFALELPPAVRLAAATCTAVAVVALINVVAQQLMRKPREPPLAFHWFPFIGNTITYGINPPQFFRNMQKKYGNIFTFILLGKKTTVFVGTEGNDFILNAKLRDVSAEDIYTVLTTPVFGKDVVYDCPNSKLMEQKKLMKVALTTEAFRSYVPIISDEVTGYFKRSADFKGGRGVVDMPPKVAQITIFTASHALQGKNVRSRLDESLADLYHDLDMGFTPINFVLHWAPLPWNKRRDHAQRTVASIYMDIMRQRREEAEAAEKAGAPRAHHHDLLWHLMNSSYKDGVRVPDHEVAHMMIAMLMAGQHSSSSTGSWIMLRLASRPDVMEELYQEQLRVLGPEPLPPLQYEDLSRFPLHQAVVKETLRLHAPIHSIMRAVKSPMAVPDTGYVVPAGHVLLAAPGFTSADDRYFPDPMTWEPRRWEKDSALAPANMTTKSAKDTKTTTTTTTTTTTRKKHVQQPHPSPTGEDDEELARTAGAEEEEQGRIVSGRHDEGQPSAGTTVADAPGEEETDPVFGLISKGARSPYLPFGAGRHRCIGEQFAHLQLEVIVAEVVRLFRFSNLDGSRRVADTDFQSLFSRPMEPSFIRWERRETAA